VRASLGRVSEPDDQNGTSQFLLFSFLIDYPFKCSGEIDLKLVPYAPSRLRTSSSIVSFVQVTKFRQWYLAGQDALYERPLMRQFSRALI
jgi:hypothetical protein